MAANTLDGISDLVLDNMINSGHLPYDKKEQVGVFLWKFRLGLFIYNSDNYPSKDFEPSLDNPLQNVDTFLYTFRFKIISAISPWAFDLQLGQLSE